MILQGANMNSGEPGYSFFPLSVGGGKKSKQQQAVRGKELRKYLGSRTTS